MEPPVDVCRLCLSEVCSKNVTLIFKIRDSGFLWRNEDLLDDILEILNLEIIYNPDWPVSVCSVCLDSINFIRDFKSACIRSNTALQNGTEHTDEPYNLDEKPVFAINNPETTEYDEILTGGDIDENVYRNVVDNLVKSEPLAADVDDESPLFTIERVETYQEHNSLIEADDEAVVKAELFETDPEEVSNIDGGIYENGEAKEAAGLDEREEVGGSSAAEVNNPDFDESYVVKVEPFPIDIDDPLIGNEHFDENQESNEEYDEIVEDGLAAVSFDVDLSILNTDKCKAKKRRKKKNVAIVRRSQRFENKEMRKPWVTYGKKRGRKPKNREVIPAEDMVAWTNTENDWKAGDAVVKKEFMDLYDVDQVWEDVKPVMTPKNVDEQYYNSQTENDDDNFLNLGRDSGNLEKIGSSDDGKRPKGKRGRPRKYPHIKWWKRVGNFSQADPTVNEGKKRKKGRPRKYPNVSKPHRNDEFLNAHKGSVETKEKVEKRPGRPRKKKYWGRKPLQEGGDAENLSATKPQANETYFKKSEEEDFETKGIVERATEKAKEQCSKEEMEENGEKDIKRNRNKSDPEETDTDNEVTKKGIEHGLEKKLNRTNSRKKRTCLNCWEMFTKGEYRYHRTVCLRCSLCGRDFHSHQGLILHIKMWCLNQEKAEIEPSNSNSQSLNNTIEENENNDKSGYVSDYGEFFDKFVEPKPKKGKRRRKELIECPDCTVFDLCSDHVNTEYAKTVKSLLEEVKEKLPNDQNENPAAQKPLVTKKRFVPEVVCSKDKWRQVAATHDVGDPNNSKHSRYLNQEHNYFSLQPRRPPSLLLSKPMLKTQRFLKSPSQVVKKYDFLSSDNLIQVRQRQADDQLLQIYMAEAMESIEGSTNMDDPERTQVQNTSNVDSMAQDHHVDDQMLRTFLVPEPMKSVVGDNNMEDPERIPNANTSNEDLIAQDHHVDEAVLRKFVVSEPMESVVGYNNMEDPERTPSASTSNGDLMAQDLDDQMLRTFVVPQPLESVVSDINMTVPERSPNTSNGDVEDGMTESSHVPTMACDSENVIDSLDHDNLQLDSMNAPQDQETIQLTEEGNQVTGVENPATSIHPVLVPVGIVKKRQLSLAPEIKDELLAPEMKGKSLLIRELMKLPELDGTPRNIPRKESKLVIEGSQRKRNRELVVSNSFNYLPTPPSALSARIDKNKLLKELLKKPVVYKQKTKPVRNKPTGRTTLVLGASQTKVMEHKIREKRADEVQGKVLAEDDDVASTLPDVVETPLSPGSLDSSQPSDSKKYRSAFADYSKPMKRISRRVPVDDDDSSLTEKSLQIQVPKLLPAPVSILPKLPSNPEEKKRLIVVPKKLFLKEKGRRILHNAQMGPNAPPISEKDVESRVFHSLIIKNHISKCDTCQKFRLCGRYEQLCKSAHTAFAENIICIMDDTNQNDSWLSLNKRQAANTGLTKKYGNTEGKTSSTDTDGHQEVAQGSSATVVADDNQLKDLVELKNIDCPPNNRMEPDFEYFVPVDRAELNKANNSVQPYQSKTCDVATVEDVPANNHEDSANNFILQALVDQPTKSASDTSTMDAVPENSGMGSANYLVPQGLRYKMEDFTEKNTLESSANNFALRVSDDQPTERNNSKMEGTSLNIDESCEYAYKQDARSELSTSFTSDDIPVYNDITLSSNVDRLEAAQNDSSEDVAGFNEGSTSGNKTDLPTTDDHLLETETYDDLLTMEAVTVSNGDFVNNAWTTEAEQRTQNANYEVPASAYEECVETEEYLDSSATDSVSGYEDLSCPSDSEESAVISTQKETTPAKNFKFGNASQSVIRERYDIISKISNLKVPFEGKQSGHQKEGLIVSEKAATTKKDSVKILNFPKHSDLTPRKSENMKLVGSKLKNHLPSECEDSENELSFSRHRKGQCTGQDDLNQVPGDVVYLSDSDENEIDGESVNCKNRLPCSSMDNEGTNEKGTLSAIVKNEKIILPKGTVLTKQLLCKILRRQNNIKNDNSKEFKVFKVVQTFPKEGETRVRVLPNDLPKKQATSSVPSSSLRPTGSEMKRKALYPNASCSKNELPKRSLALLLGGKLNMGQNASPKEKKIEKNKERQRTSHGNDSKLPCPDCKLDNICSVHKPRTKDNRPKIVDSIRPSADVAGELGPDSTHGCLKCKTTPKCVCEKSAKSQGDGPKMKKKDMKKILTEIRKRRKKKVNVRDKSETSNCTILPLGCEECKKGIACANHMITIEELYSRVRYEICPKKSSQNTSDPSLLPNLKGLEEVSIECQSSNILGPKISQKDFSHGSFSESISNAPNLVEINTGNDFREPVLESMEENEGRAGSKMEVVLEIPPLCKNIQQPKTESKINFAIRSKGETGVQEMTSPIKKDHIADYERKDAKIEVVLEIPPLYTNKEQHEADTDVKSAIIPKQKAPSTNIKSPIRKLLPKIAYERDTWCLAKASDLENTSESSLVSSKNEVGNDNNMPLQKPKHVGHGSSPMRIITPKIVCTKDKWRLGNPSESSLASSTNQEEEDVLPSQQTGSSPMRIVTPKIISAKDKWCRPLTSSSKEIQPNSLGSMPSSNDITSDEKKVPQKIICEQETFQTENTSLTSSTSNEHENRRNFMKNNSPKIVLPHDSKRNDYKGGVEDSLENTHKTLERKEDGIISLIASQQLKFLPDQKLLAPEIVSPEGKPSHDETRLKKSLGQIQELLEDLKTKSQAISGGERGKKKLVPKIVCAKDRWRRDVAAGCVESKPNGVENSDGNLDHAMRTGLRRILPEELCQTSNMGNSKQISNTNGPDENSFEGEVLKSAQTSKIIRHTQNVTSRLEVPEVDNASVEKERRGKGKDRSLTNCSSNMNTTDSELTSNSRKISLKPPYFILSSPHEAQMNCFRCRNNGYPCKLHRVSKKEAPGREKIVLKLVGGENKWRTVSQNSSGFSNDKSLKQDYKTSVGHKKKLKERTSTDEEKKNGTVKGDREEQNTEQVPSVDEKVRKKRVRKKKDLEQITNQKPPVKEYEKMSELEEAVLISEEKEKVALAGNEEKNKQQQSMEQKAEDVEKGTEHEETEEVLGKSGPKKNEQQQNIEQKPPVTENEKINELEDAICICEEKEKVNEDHEKNEELNIDQESPFKEAEKVEKLEETLLIGEEKEKVPKKRGRKKKVLQQIIDQKPRTEGNEKMIELEEDISTGEEKEIVYVAGDHAKNEQQNIDQELSAVEAEKVKKHEEPPREETEKVPKKRGRKKKVQQQIIDQESLLKENEKVMEDDGPLCIGEEKEKVAEEKDQKKVEEGQNMEPELPAEEQEVKEHYEKVPNTKMGVQQNIDQSPSVEEKEIEKEVGEISRLYEDKGKAPGKRGRKKKQPPETVVQETPIESIKEEASLKKTGNLNEREEAKLICEDKEKVPKKRGRKRKEQQQNIDQEPLVEGTELEKEQGESPLSNEEKEKLPQKIGRKKELQLPVGPEPPSKTVKPNSSTHETDLVETPRTDEEKDKVPKKRGRKKKELQLPIDQEPPSKTVKQNSSIHETDLVETPRTDEEKDKVPKKRGRKKKELQMPIDQEPPSEIVKPDPSSQEIDQGKPPCTDEIVRQNSSTHENYLVETPRTDEEKDKVPKKRGRKKKKLQLPIDQEPPSEIVKPDPSSQEIDQGKPPCTDEIVRQNSSTHETDLVETPRTDEEKDKVPKKRGRKKKKLQLPIDQEPPSEIVKQDPSTQKTHHGETPRAVEEPEKVPQKRGRKKKESQLQIEQETPSEIVKQDPSTQETHQGETPRTVEETEKVPQKRGRKKKELQLPLDQETKSEIVKQDSSVQEADPRETPHIDEENEKVSKIRGQKELQLPIHQETPSEIVKQGSSTQEADQGETLCTVEEKDKVSKNRDRKRKQSGPVQESSVESSLGNSEIKDCLECIESADCVDHIAGNLASEETESTIMEGKIVEDFSKRSPKKPRRNSVKPIRLDL